MNQTQENTQQEYTPIPLTPKVVLYPMMWAFFAVLMSVATLFMPYLSIVTVAFGSVSFAMMRLFAPSTAYERLLPIIFAVVSLLITNSLTLTTLLLGVFLPGGYTMSWVIGKKKSFNYAVASQLLVYALYTALVFIVLMGEYGDFELDNIIDPFAAVVKDAFGSIYDSMQSMPVDAGELAIVPTAQVVLPEYSSFILNVITGDATRANFVYDGYMFILQFIPTAVGVIILATGALSYWMAKGILRRNKKLDRENVKFFTNFDAFRVSTVGAVIYVILSALSFITSGDAAVVLSIFTSVMSVAFCYEGLSLVAFFMNIRGYGRIIKGIVLVILFCMAPVLSNILSLLGLLDCFWNLRQFVRPSGRYM